MKKKVLLGMSGGVDSSVSAILLKQAGYEIIGVTMMLWENVCQNSSSAVQDAKKVCQQLGITHHTIELQKEFKKHVIDQFIYTYQEGQTPNPCIECNKYIKFGLLYQKAMELGCDFLATGHYAKIEYNKKYQSYVLRKSEAEKKDQTYFLYGIAKEILPHIIFPLSNFSNKEEIRKMAQEYGLNIAQKPDSQEVCFIPDNDYTGFLKKQEKLPMKEGNFVTTKGEILGKHRGLIHYTVGQRKGLGISYQQPLYVIKLEKEKNQVIVGTEEELYQKQLYANKLNFLLPYNENMNLKAKIRYRSKEADCILNFINNDTVKVEFKEPQRAITPGQSVVFYWDDIVVGGGKII